MSVSTNMPSDLKFSIWVTFAEIYNEQVYDLLEPLNKAAPQAKRKTMSLREDKNGNPFIKGNVPLLDHLVLMILLLTGVAAIIY